MSRKRKVAVLGARGIGRHHANWWRHEGAELAAILGRTDESVRMAAETLHEMMGFSGTGYTDLAKLLKEQQPDIVDVSVTAAAHFALAKEALEAGCHVLCEKPLVYDAALTPEAMMKQAESLTTLARERKRTFGLCSQFSVASRTCYELFNEHVAEPLRQIQVELRSPERGRKPNPVQTWIDLGPHLIAALQTVMPAGEPDWATLDTTTGGHQMQHSFMLNSPDGQQLEVLLTVGFTTGQPANVRRITLNDTAFDLLGESGPDGIFRMRYRTDGKIDVPRPDPMRLLIREFLAGQPPLGADAAYRNQQMLLRLLP